MPAPPVLAGRFAAPPCPGRPHRRRGAERDRPRRGSASKRRERRTSTARRSPTQASPRRLARDRLACGPPSPRTTEEAAATGSPGGYRRAGSAGRRREGGPGPRRSFPAASACAPNQSPAARRGPGPGGPLPASRPSQGSAPPPRHRGGRGAAAQSLVPAPRGRGGGGERPSALLGLSAAPRPAAGPQGAPQTLSPPGAGRSPPASL